VRSTPPPTCARMARLRSRRKASSAGRSWNAPFISAHSTSPRDERFRHRHSVQIYDEIKNNFSTAIISTKLPLDKTISLSRKKHIAIMASKGTLDSKEFNYLIKKEIPQQIFVDKVDSSEIINLVESGSFLFDQKFTSDKIREIIESNIDDTIDVIALGSTHLPFVKNYIEDILPSIKFINSSAEVAKDVKSYLKYTGDLDKNKNSKGKLEILVSADKKNFQSILRYMGIKEIIFDVSLQM